MRRAREAKNGAEAEERARQHTAHLDAVEAGRGGQIALVCTVGFLVLAGVVSVGSWEFFQREAEPINNLVLPWGAPLALGLARWRSLVAQRQVTVAEKGVPDARYQRAVVMLGHEFLGVRGGGSHALRNLAREHPQDAGEAATGRNLSARGKRWAPTVENTEPGITRPADEWEAAAAQGLSEAQQRRGRQTGLSGSPCGRYFLWKMPPARLLPASQKASTVKGQMYGSAARDCEAAFFAFRVGILCPEGGRDGR